MEIENGIRLKDVIQSLVVYDCMVPEFWRFVSDFFGTDVLKNENYNKQITTTLKSLFWYQSVNGNICKTESVGYALRYDVDGETTKFLSILLDGEVLWELKL